MQYFHMQRLKMQESASGLLNTMIAVGNAMGIAFIGSIFLGLIGIGCGAASAIRIHYYSDALIN